MAKDYIEEYFVKVSMDSEKAIPDLKRTLDKYEQMVKTANQRMRGLEQATTAAAKRTSKAREKGYTSEQTHRNKQLSDMSKYYKQLEKRASLAHNTTENLKTNAKYNKLSISQQDVINRKLKQASAILNETGNTDLFKEIRRDMTVMQRQSSTIAKNMQKAADQRLQARNDLRDAGRTVGRAALVAGTASGVGAAISTKKLIEIGKGNDKLITSMTETFGKEKGMLYLKDIQDEISKLGGSIENSIDGMTTAMPLLSAKMGADSVSFYKDIMRTFVANNVESSEYSAALKQLNQAQTGIVNWEDFDQLSERLPLFRSFFSEQISKQYGKTVKELTSKGQLTTEMLNAQIKAYSKSAKVVGLITKSQTGMAKKQVDIQNAIYKRFLEVYNENGDELKKAMDSLTDAVNSPEGKQAFRALASMLSGVYDSTSNLVRFAGSLASEGDNLIDSFSKLETTASKVVVALAGMYAGKKIVDAGVWFTKLFKNLKTANMNVAAAVVNIVGKGGAGLGGGGGTKNTTKPSAIKAVAKGGGGLLAGSLAFSKLAAKVAARVAVPAAGVALTAYEVKSFAEAQGKHTGGVMANGISSLVPLVSSLTKFANNSKGLLTDAKNHNDVMPKWLENFKNSKLDGNTQPVFKPDIQILNNMRSDVQPMQHLKGGDTNNTNTYNVTVNATPQSDGGVSALNIADSVRNELYKFSNQTRNR
ncbi:hypothetical protein [Pseudoalteromonas sp. SCQQ13]|uniref:hypothetical protein n=1 Tax=Pseudoalteromonas sp. SCQQ13 TaxID=2792066 RepID=UPI0018CE94EC|nr:hypothetical protein [Pseudoalteromonas sp. SCQQ13]MBH0093337.1 hypothetical protein [Pseudoalteromonas sp. SCQQ13]